MCKECKCNDELLEDFPFLEGKTLDDLLRIMSRKLDEAKEAVVVAEAALCIIKAAAQRGDENA